MFHLKIKKQVINATLAAIAGSVIYVASNVSAEPGLYVGGAIGWGRVEDSDFDDDDPAYKILAGGKFNDYIGVEVAANDYGEAKRRGYSSELRGNTVAVVGCEFQFQRIAYFKG